MPHDNELYLGIVGAETSTAAPELHIGTSSSKQSLSALFFFLGGMVLLIVLLVLFFILKKYIRKGKLKMSSTFRVVTSPGGKYDSVC